MAGLLAGAGFAIGYLLPGGRIARVAHSAPAGARASPALHLGGDRARHRPDRLRALLHPRARMAPPGVVLLPREGAPVPASPQAPRPPASTSSPRSSWSCRRCCSSSRFGRRWARQPQGKARGLAALASVAAFCAYNLGAGQRRYLIEMLVALALYYYLRRDRRPSLWSVAVVLVVALTVFSAIRDLRLSTLATTIRTPSSGCRGTRQAPVRDAGHGGRALARPRDARRPVGASLHDGGTTIVGPIRTLIPRRSGPTSRCRPTTGPEDRLRRQALHPRGQCDTFSPLGEPYRDGGLPAVFVFAVLSASSGRSRGCTSRDIGTPSSPPSDTRPSCRS